MSRLSIYRLSATAAPDWPAPGEVAGMLRRVADERLERALAAQPLPEGDWCVRRIDVAVDLDPERPLNALETDWADRIVTALRQSLRDGSRDVVRYLRPEQAVDDLLRGLVAGRCERDWAWRQVGLLLPGDPDPRADARGVFLAMLARLPQGPSAAIERLVRRVGLTPVHRLLGRDGWTRVAALAVPGADLDLLLGDPRTAAPSAQSGRRAAAAAARAALARTLTGTGVLPAAVRTAALRADQPTTRAWALLTVAAADPSLLRRPAAEVGGLVRDVASLLVPAPGRTLGDRASAGADQRDRRAVGSSADGRRDSAPPSVTPAEDAAPVPQDPLAAEAPEAAAVVAPTARDRVPVEAFDPVDDGALVPAYTAWGGLAFLLNSAAAAGLPEVLDEPPFFARPAAWVLRRLGRVLVDAAADDPALLALAGAEEAVGQAAPSEAEQEAIDACAGRWAAVTAARLRADRPGDAVRPDADLVRDLARREATVLWEPGWVEVCLRLTDVDLDVRRAGLDLDPGWVWWLGQVVRFRYE